MEPDWSLSDTYERTLVVMEVAVSQSSASVIAKAHRWLELSSNLRAVVVVNLDESPRYVGPQSWEKIGTSVRCFNRALRTAAIGQPIENQGYTWFGTCTKVDVTVLYRPAYFILPPELKQPWSPRFPPTPYAGEFQLRAVPYRISSTKDGHGDAEPDDEDVESDDEDVESDDDDAEPGDENAEPDKDIRKAEGKFALTSAQDGFEGMADVDFALQQVCRVVSLCCCEEDDAGFLPDWEHVRAAVWTGVKKFAKSRWEARPPAVAAGKVRTSKNRDQDNGELGDGNEAQRRRIEEAST